MNNPRTLAQFLIACTFPCLFLTGWMSAPLRRLPPYTGTGSSGSEDCTSCPRSTTGSSFQSTQCYTVNFVMGTTSSGTCTASCEPVTNCKFSFTVSIVDVDPSNPCGHTLLYTYCMRPLPTGNGACSPPVPIALPFQQNVTDHQVLCAREETATITDGPTTLVKIVLTCNPCQ